MECYHWEIEQLKMLNEVSTHVIDDLRAEEEKLYTQRIKVNPHAYDKTQTWYLAIKSRGRDPENPKNQ
jgi:hypothetical protein